MERHKHAIQIGLTLLAVVMIGLLFAYCSSSSEVQTDKADKYAQQSANSHVESVQAETNANVIAEQIEAVSEDREEAKKQYAKAKKKISKVQYEKIVNQPVVIDTNDLDARERKLLARLRKQQSGTN